MNVSPSLSLPLSLSPLSLSLPLSSLPRNLSQTTLTIVAAFLDLAMDLAGFNILVMTNFYPTVAAPGVSDGTVVVAANRSINLFPMPARYFCSGHTFFIQQSGRRERCLNVHVTFTEGGVHGKLWRLQEAGLWNLHPKGYFDSGRYLTIRSPPSQSPTRPPGLNHSSSAAPGWRGAASLIQRTMAGGRLPTPPPNAQWRQRSTTTRTGTEA